MDNIIIKPLYDDYDVINIKATALEDYLLCPKKHKEVPRQDTHDMLFGTLAHDMVIQYLYSKDPHIYDMMVEYFINQHRGIDIDYPTEKEKQKMLELEKKRLTDYLDLAHFNLPKIFLGEKFLILPVECGKYLVNIRMKIDMVDTDMVVSDMKTAKSKRQEGIEHQKFQKDIYTFAFWNSMGVTEGEKDFYYYVFSKHRRDPCTIDPRHCKIDLQKAKQKIIQTVTNYVISHHKDLWPPQRNILCKGCELFKKNLCEVHNPILIRNQDEYESTDSSEDGLLHGGDN